MGISTVFPSKLTLKGCDSDELLGGPRLKTSYVGVKRVNHPWMSQNADSKNLRLCFLYTSTFSTIFDCLFLCLSTSRFNLSIFQASRIKQERITRSTFELPFSRY